MDMLVTRTTNAAGRSIGKRHDGTDQGDYQDEPDKSAHDDQKSVSGIVDSLECQHLKADTTDAKPMGEGDMEGVSLAGHRTEDGGDMTDARLAYVRDVPVSPAPLYKDCLIMYATTPGIKLL